MAILIKGLSVAAESLATGVTCKRLVTEQSVKNTNVLVNHLTLAAGATSRFAVAAQGVVWLQMLEGEAQLKTPYFKEQMADGHSVTLPPGFQVDLSTERGASLISFEIADAHRVDPELEIDKVPFAVINWTTEPFFQSERDARKRIVLDAPEIGGTSAFKAEMVLYPAACAAPMHCREGADTVTCVVAGVGTAWVAEQSYPMSAGDLIYCPSGELHRLQTGERSDMRFVEFCVPGKSTTVWADPSQVSAWEKSDRDIYGRLPAREVLERRIYRHVYGAWGSLT